jgi:hypothetical protein
MMRSIIFLVCSILISLIFGCHDAPPAVEDLIIHTKNLKWEPKAFYTLRGKNDDIGYSPVFVSPNYALSKLGFIKSQKLYLEFSESLKDVSFPTIDLAIKMVARKKIDSKNFNLCQDPEFMALAIPEVKKLLNLSPLESDPLKYMRNLGAGSFSCVYKLEQGTNAPIVLKIRKFDRGEAHAINNLKRDLINAKLFNLLAKNVFLIREHAQGKKEKIKFLEAAEIFYSNSSLSRGVTWQKFQSGPDIREIAHLVNQILQKPIDTKNPQEDLKKLGFATPLIAVELILAVEGFFHQTNDFVKDYLLANGIEPVKNQFDHNKWLGFDFGQGSNQIFNKDSNTFVAIDF